MSTLKGTALGVLAACAADPARWPAPPADPWLARLYLNRAGRPTLEPAAVTPAGRTYPVVLADVPEDMRAAFWADVVDQLPDYAAPAAWAYPRYGTPAHDAAFAARLPFQLIEYGLVVAADLAGRPSPPPGRSLARVVCGGPHPVADAHARRVYPWAAVAGTLAAAGLDVRKYAVVMSAAALAACRRPPKE